eukprot:CAMPEP_0183389432 /NCGR_PEP_ID=MMETSP0370-20130417/4926_1 /TAXON_ID=268820 /ORGANISM="Peridinium aciculiferum, Strain PAER-2" /LENGTH=38 /DNA_ID= /DNA_START= /DNA_END= /DNA_ORIENTATION=
MLLQHMTIKAKNVTGATFAAAASHGTCGKWRRAQPKKL